MKYEFNTDYVLEDYILNTKWSDLPENIRDRAIGCGIDLMTALILGSRGRQFAAGRGFVEKFCGENEVPAGTAMQLQLAVEELCAVTIAQAFSGKPEEYIRVTLAKERDSRYVLHIRNSAPYFNPLDMKMEKARTDMTAEVMDSIGVMMVQKKAKNLSYRNYQGYNVMTVEY